MALELLVHPASGPKQAVPLEGQVAIGRGPDNDLVLTIDRVSWNHALVWENEGKVFVKDLGSRNGTRLDGQPITDPTEWQIGTRLQIEEVELTFEVADPREPKTFRSMSVEDVSSGVRFPLRQSHTLIGDDPNADLRIPEGSGVSGVLIAHPDGEVWLGINDEDQPLKPGETFTIGGVELRLVEAEAGWLPTATDEDTSHPYVVETAFDPDRGPWARFRCLDTGRSHTLTADNRVAMIYFLAEALRDDFNKRVTDPGWRSNESVRVAVWGRSARHEGPRKLKALLHNIRAELRGASLDPWCLEKRRGFVRLRVRQVEVT
ncbi:MAG: FHA domain-containing protein [Myxococcota bacterium]